MTLKSKTSMGRTRLQGSGPAPGREAEWWPGHPQSVGLLGRLGASSGIALMSTTRAIDTVVGAALLFITVLPARSRREVVVPASLVALVVWALASVIWSATPYASSKEALRLVLVVVSMAFLAARSCWHLVAHCMVLGLGGLSSVCVVWGILRPGLALDNMGGLRGVLVHANLVAYVSAAALLGAVFLGAVAPRKRPYVMVGLVSAIALVWSGSATSMVATAAALGVGMIARMVRRFGLRYWVPVAGLVGSATVLGGIWMAANLPVVMTDIGRDVTLTGRTEIWAAILGMIALRPWTGYGLGAPWAEGSDLGASLAQQVGFAFSSAHNGPLEVLLQLGVVGLVIVTLILARALARWLPAALSRSRPTSWGLSLLTFLVVLNMTEATVLQHAGLLMMTALLVTTPPGSTQVTWTDRGQPRHLSDDCSFVGRT